MFLNTSLTGKQLRHKTKGFINEITKCHHNFHNGNYHQSHHVQWPHKHLLYWLAQAVHLLNYSAGDNTEISGLTTILIIRMKLKASIISRTIQINSTVAIVFLFSEQLWPCSNCNYQISSQIASCVLMSKIKI